MTRRTIGFLVTLALGLLVAPLMADAQQPTNVYRIGLLIAGTGPSLEAFRQGLRDLGYVEGQTIVLEERWAERKLERLPDLAAELVQLQVNVKYGNDSPLCAAGHNGESLPDLGWVLVLDVPEHEG